MKEGVAKEGNEKERGLELSLFSPFLSRFFL